MILSKGVTGFFNYKEEMILNDGDKFVKRCKEFIYNNSGKLIAVDLSLSEKNFYYVECMISDKKLFILLNAYYPFLAVAMSVDFKMIEFMDINISVYPLDLEYQILSYRELNSQYNLEELKKYLSKVEIKEINYWQPDTIGRIIFNYWD